MNNVLELSITIELDLYVMVREDDKRIIYKEFIPAANIPDNKEDYSKDLDIIYCIETLKRLIKSEGTFRMCVINPTYPINYQAIANRAAKSLQLANYIIDSLPMLYIPNDKESIIIRLDKIHSRAGVSTYPTIRKIVYGIANNPKILAADKSQMTYIDSFVYKNYTTGLYVLNKEDFYKHGWTKVVALKLGAVTIVLFDSEGQEHIFALLEGDRDELETLTVAGVVYLLKGILMHLEIDHKEDKKMIISTKNEATEKYLAYINNHIRKVREGFERYGEELCKVCKADYDKVLINIGKHDLSKFGSEEFDEYLDKFYPYKDIPNEEVERRFNIAWLHHIHNNPHHPEHWVLTGTESGIDEVFEMPPEYIVEMILDWDTFKKEDGTGGAYDYYFKDGNKKEGLLHPSTRDILERALQIVK